MPDTDVVQKWMTEVTSTIVTNNHRLEAVEKSIDEQRKVTERATQALERVAVAEEERTRAQERIATTEEERTKIFQQVERDRKKTEKEQLTLQTERSGRLNQWMERVWASPQGQILLTLILIALMNFLGFGWLAQQILPVHP